MSLLVHSVLFAARKVLHHFSQQGSGSSPKHTASIGKTFVSAAWQRARSMDTPPAPWPSSCVLCVCVLLMCLWIKETVQGFYSFIRHKQRIDCVSTGPKFRWVLRSRGSFFSGSLPLFELIGTQLLLVQRCLLCFRGKWQQVRLKGLGVREVGAWGGGD